MHTNIYLSNDLRYPYLLLTNVNNVFTQCSWYSTSVHQLESLCTSLRSAWCTLVTPVTVVTHRLELRIGVISPNVCRFHTVVAVLAVRNSVPWHTLHPRHHSHTASRVLNEVVLRVQLSYEFKHVLVYGITEMCVVTYWV